MKVIILISLTFSIGIALAQDAALSGHDIYTKHCADCHGDKGQGVEEEYEDPLQGTKSLKSLTRYIDRYMPEEDPDLLDADESQKVAEYIMGAFYSRPGGEQGKRQKMAFSRLTNRQFRESVADLIGSFGPTSGPGKSGGLKAVYFESDGMNKKAKFGFEKIDGVLDFDFAEGSPGEGIGPEQFSISWDGSLLAPADGWYEFRLSTPNGARLYLNSGLADGDRNERDDGGGKRSTALIDAWVSSGTEIRQVSARVYLLGGRAYSLRLDYFKFKEKLGMIRLEWKPPQGEWQILSDPYLSAEPAVPVAVVDTLFPPDDASEGYERGTGISKAWLEAVSTSAVNTANLVIDRLPRISGVKKDDADREVPLKAFVENFATRAFRRPLSEDLRKTYVDSQFTPDLPTDLAVKRALILILQSPRFLYPEIGETKDDFTVATRIALGIWDSLPDKELLDLASQGQLRSRDAVATQARRMMDDPRAKAKLGGFFRHWLKLDVEADLQKDTGLHPGFDAGLVADLRRSLELFVEEIVWSESSDYRVLMEAEHLHLNERLAKFYGVPWPGGSGFQKLVVDPGKRAGVMTHPYLLARMAHHRETSPILRGVFITRNVLGGILKPPPEAIAFEDGHFVEGMTTREKVVQMTSSSSCMTCHETINPLGFSLENFDAVGRYRLQDNDRLIDSESDFESFEGDTVRLRGPRDLARQALDSPSARKGFVRQVFQEMIKQNPRSYDPGTLSHLEKHFRESGFHIRNLLAEINLLAALEGVSPGNPDPP